MEPIAVRLAPAMTMALDMRVSAAEILGNTRIIALLVQRSKRRFGQMAVAVALFEGGAGACGRGTHEHQSACRPPSVNRQTL
jgi:hypothetical protein